MALTKKDIIKEFLFNALHAGMASQKPTPIDEEYVDEKADMLIEELRKIEDKGGINDHHNKK